METNAVMIFRVFLWALLAATATVFAAGSPTPTGTAATGGGAGVPVAAPAGAQEPPAERLLYEIPEPPGAALSQGGVAAPRTPPAAASVDAAVVARELGATLVQEERADQRTDIDMTMADGGNGWLEFRRRYRLHGLLSVGMGSHGSYQAGIGISATLTPSATISAGAAAGRWADGLGWWYAEPWLDGCRQPPMAPWP